MTDPTTVTRGEGIRWRLINVTFTNNFIILGIRSRTNVIKVLQTLWFTYVINSHIWPLDFTEWPLDFSTEHQTWWTSVSNVLRNTDLRITVNQIKFKSNKHIKSCLIVHEETVAKSKLCFSKMSFQFSETEEVYACAYVCAHASFRERERERGLHERVRHVCVCVWHVGIYSTLCQYFIG